jgi:hypothetical protein
MKEQLTSTVSVAVSRAARVRQTLWLTQSAFFAMLAVCVIVYHGHTANTDGISYYGVYGPTIPVLFAGFLTAAWGLWWVSGPMVLAGAPDLLGPGLRVIAIGLVVLLVTPFDRGTFLNWAHMITGVVMALVQIALSVALIVRRANWASICAFVVLLAGGIMGALSLPDWHVSLLLAGECLLEVGFAWCLIEWTSALSPGDRVPST